MTIAFHVRPRRVLGIATALTLFASSGLADSLVLPSSSGDHRKGSLTLPLFRGFAVQPEGTVLALPNNCEREMKLTIRWDEEANWVKVKLTGRGVLEPRPTIRRTEGVDFFPNPFWPESRDIVKGRYQLWFITAAEDLTFYYDAATRDLLGSELDFPAQPPDTIAVTVPSTKVVGGPMFQPDARGDVDLEYTLAYDAIVRADRPDLAHLISTYPAPNLCLSNPYRYDLSTSRGYIRARPASEARPFSDYLRNGIMFNITVEPPEYFTEPPLDHPFATYGNATLFGGGAPRGYLWDIDAAFMNLAPPYRPWVEGAGKCERWFRPVHTRGLNFCEPSP